jgi:amino acid adenylation domain-containing protein
MAAALTHVGVRPGDRVAVSAAKSVNSVTALYSTMRAGAAYVPIDPYSPPLRTSRLLQDCGCRVLCVDGTRASRLPGFVEEPSPVAVIGLDDTVDQPTIAAADLPQFTPSLDSAACESDLAYILYTSGSTGSPKGVMLTHRNALSFVEWAVDRFAVGAGDRLSSHAPFHFDLSVFDIFGAALAAAPVHLLAGGEGGFGSAMAALVRDQAITVWYSVPSALVLLMEASDADSLASLRVVLFAGEVFPMKHLRRLRSMLPRARLANLYGPTETNVCTYCSVPSDLADMHSLPIGRACENQEVFALDDELRPVPPGGIGELWVRGPTVMKGYWGAPGVTAEALRQNPLHDRFPDPAYRTGDLVRQRPDGMYDFLGRRDHQIKSRGYRIELGEIEAALVSHDAVREAAVVAVPDERIGHALVGFVATVAGLDPTDLKRHCLQRLPRYMVPGRIVVSETLPHTSTGKIDRQKLAAEAESDAAESQQGP